MLKIIGVRSRATRGATCEGQRSAGAVISWSLSLSSHNQLTGLLYSDGMLSVIALQKGLLDEVLDGDGVSWLLQKSSTSSTMKTRVVVVILVITAQRLATKLKVCVLKNASSG